MVKRLMRGVHALSFRPYGSLQIKIVDFDGPRADDIRHSFTCLENRQERGTSSQQHRERQRITATIDREKAEFVFNTPYQFQQLCRSKRGPLVDAGHDGWLGRWEISHKAVRRIRVILAPDLPRTFPNSCDPQALVDELNRLGQDVEFAFSTLWTQGHKFKALQSIVFDFNSHPLFGDILLEPTVKSLMSRLRILVQRYRKKVSHDRIPARGRYYTFTSFDREGLSDNRGSTSETETDRNDAHGSNSGTSIAASHGHADGHPHDVQNPAGSPLNVVDNAGSGDRGPSGVSAQEPGFNTPSGWPNELCGVWRDRVQHVSNSEWHDFDGANDTRSPSSGSRSSHRHDADALSGEVSRQEDNSRWTGETLVIMLAQTHGGAASSHDRAAPVRNFSRPFRTFPNGRDHDDRPLTQECREAREQAHIAHLRDLTLRILEGRGP